MFVAALATCTSAAACQKHLSPCVLRLCDCEEEHTNFGFIEGYNTLRKMFSFIEDTQQKFGSV